MKSYGRLEVRIHTFSTLAPVAVTLPAPPPVRFTPGLTVSVYTLDRRMLRPYSPCDCCRPETYVTRQVVWHVTSRTWTSGSWGFDGTYCLHLYGPTVQKEVGLLYPLTQKQHVCSKHPEPPTERHRVTSHKILTLRRLMSYIYGAPILDVSRSHTTTHHSR